MKIKIQAVVTFKWEEDSADWVGLTQEEMIEVIHDQCVKDHSRFLEQPIVNIYVGEAP